jgi:hypothetical protein
VTIADRIQEPPTDGDGDTAEDHPATDPSASRVFANEQPAASMTERRAYPRSDSFYPVRLHVERLGAESTLRHGILLNVSRGGALLSVDGYMPRDQPCEVEIYGAAGRVIPHRIFSRVVETSVGEGDDFRIRVEFSKPLETITRPDEI